jgi:hypothetical protein
VTEASGLLDEIVRELRRYVVMASVQADAVALWILHTHAHDAAEVTPYLWIAGPERRVGKSRLLDVLALYVRKPVPTANVSEAAVFRLVAAAAPTLLFDEIDSVFGPKARDREDLRGLLNAGFQRGAMAWRCVGDGSKQTVESFPVFCPKTFAGIGHVLPDTLADRAIRIDLKRKRRDEPVDRFRKRQTTAQAGELRDAVASWAERSVDRLAELRPELPDELDDRAQDAWEPLLALADLAGGEWPARARAAALELSGEKAAEDDSIGVRLLADCRRVFYSSPAGGEQLATSALTDELAADDEAPWGSWRGDGPITARALAGILRRYEIRPRQLWVAGVNVRGFRRDDFEDAWRRYLPANPPDRASFPLDPLDSSNHAGLRAKTDPLDEAALADTEEAAKPYEQTALAGLADRTGDQGGGAPDGEVEDWHGTAPIDELRARYETEEPAAERPFRGEEPGA